MSGDWATSNNVDDRMRGFGITQPPALRTNWDVSGSIGGPIETRSPVVLRATFAHWANASVRRRDLREPLCGRRVALGLRGQSGDRSTRRRVAEDRRGSPDRAAHAEKRITFSHDYQRRCGGSTLKEGGDGCRQAGARLDRVGTDVRRRHCVAGIVSRVPRLPVQHHAGHVLGAGQQPHCCSKPGFSRFMYDYARFGMAPPDGLMDLIPVTEQSGHLRPSATFVSRRVRSARLRLQPERSALQTAWRASMSYVTGAHNIKVGYQGYFSAVAQRPRAEQHAAALHVQQPGPRSPCSYFLSPRWDQHDRTENAGLYAQDQWTVGRLTLQGAVRYDRAWSWAPADGNGTTGTSRFNPKPIAFDRTDSVSRLQRHHPAARASPTTCSARARRRSR